ncbi:IS3 family transposase [Paenibacillus sp. DLE-14]|uniref:IS3 family transposase n=1 Tax=Paenibacillus lignilyticus TaxID=1172615 RepID=A0ABS5CNE2_9BACL|nr:IS3 family transposase [Paenibacillus lignilyticus]
MLAFDKFRAFIKGSGESIGIRPAVQSRFLRHIRLSEAAVSGGSCSSFPEYRGVFGDLYSKVSLLFLALHRTSSSVLTLEKQMDALANELEEYQIIQSIPGIGEKIAAIRRSGSKKVKAFYDKKIDEGKPYKVAMIACVNKLLHCLFALLKRKETFIDLDLAFQPVRNNNDFVAKYYLRRTYPTFEELQKDIDTYIYFYNNKRLQAKLNGLSPVEFRTKAA